MALARKAEEFIIQNNLPRKPGAHGFEVRPKFCMRMRFINFNFLFVVFDDDWVHWNIFDTHLVMCTRIPSQHER